MSQTTESRQPPHPAGVSTIKDWLKGTAYQIANPDTDGLLTAALVHHMFDLPVVGWYDTETLWVTPALGEVSLSRTLWTDLDLCYPGARSIGQHVVAWNHDDTQIVEGYETSLNPNISHGIYGRDLATYQRKYPFGTFQWLAWMLGAPTSSDIAGNDLLTGLAWAPDGGARSIVSPRWGPNCVDWAVNKMPGGLLGDVARSDPRLAWQYVEHAQRVTDQAVGKSRIGWDNGQYKLGRGADMSGIDLGLLQAILDSWTDAFGWRRCPLPSGALRSFSGEWRLYRGQPPQVWAQSANSGQILSVALTGFHQMAVTHTSAELAGALKP